MILLFPSPIPDHTFSGFGPQTSERSRRRVTRRRSHGCVHRVLRRCLQGAGSSHQLREEMEKNDHHGKGHRHGDERRGDAQSFGGPLPGPEEELVAVVQNRAQKGDGSHSTQDPG